MNNKVYKHREGRCLDVKVDPDPTNEYPISTVINGVLRKFTREGYYNKNNPQPSRDLIISENKPMMTSIDYKKLYLNRNGDKVRVLSQMAKNYYGVAVVDDRLDRSLWFRYSVTKAGTSPDDTGLDLIEEFDFEHN